MNPSTSTLRSPSFPQLGQAPEVLQLYLQCLDRLDMLECRVHEEIQEIRSLFRNILDNCQSNVTMDDSGGCDSTVDSQAGLDGLNAITPFGYSHDRYFVPQPTPHASFGVVESLSENIEGKFAVYALFPLNPCRVQAHYCSMAPTVLPTM